MGDSMAELVAEDEGEALVEALGLLRDKVGAVGGVRRMGSVQLSSGLVVSYGVSGPQGRLIILLIKSTDPSLTLREYRELLTRL